VTYKSWLNSVGVSRVSGWRWRRAGYIRPIIIAGRLYLTATEIETFTRRALAGEFKIACQAENTDKTECYGNMPQHLAESRGLTRSDTQRKNPAKEGHKCG
jgi:hypothetical protein